MTNIRDRIEDGFEVLADGLWRFRFAAVALTIVLTAALASGVAKLTIDTSNEAFLHQDDPTLLRYLDFKAQFGRDDIIIIGVEPNDLFSPGSLEKLKALHDELAERIPNLDDLTSMVNARNTRGEGDSLIVEDLLERWPRTATDLKALEARVMANPLYINGLVSADAALTALIIEISAFAGDGGGGTDEALTGFDDEGAADKAPGEARALLSNEQNFAVVATAKKIVARHSAPDFRLYMGGALTVMEELKAALKSDMALFLRLAVLTIGICLLIMFRRISGVVLPLVVVGLSLVSTLGIMGHAGIAVTIPMIILPSFLLAVGVGAAVHILAMFFRRLNEQGDKPAALRYALGHSGLAIVMTSLTTAAGLASFSGAEVAPIAHLGIFAAVGVLLALIYTLILLPALLALIPIKAKPAADARSAPRFDAFLDGVVAFSTGHAKAIVAASIILIVGAVASAALLQFSHDVFSWLPKEWTVYKATKKLDHDLRGSITVEVLVDTRRENGLYDRDLLRALEGLGSEFEAYDRDGLFVGKVTSVVDILKEIHQALHDNQSKYYAVPDNQRLIPQEFLLFENTGSDDLETVIDSRFQVARVSIRVPWRDTLAYVPLLREVEDRFKEVLGERAKVTLTGTMSLFSRTLHAAIRSMAASYAIAFAAITVLMMLLIGNLRIGLVAMLPNLAPIAVAMGFMWWANLPLNLFTMLVGSIAIGLAVDDTIHFMHNFRRYYDQTGDVPEAVRRTLHTTGRAMLVTSIVLAIGFFIFTQAALNNLIDFGILTGAAIVLALIADFVLAPALMMLVHPKKEAT